MKLNKATIAKFTPPEGKSDHIEFDDDLTGFGLRIRNGKRSWVVQYRHHGRQRRMTFASVEKVGADQARVRAKELLAQAQLGLDPQGQKQEKVREEKVRQAKVDTTLGSVIDAYLEAKKPSLRPNTLRGATYQLTKLWSTLHPVPVNEITRADVAARLRTLIKDHGPTTAARARIALSAVFSWAMKEAYPIEQNPVINTNAPATSPARERTLSDQELGEVWNACEGCGDYGTIIRLLICTGLRRQEVGSLAWSELRDGKLQLPGSRTKNRRPHEIPILGLAADIIASVPKVEGRDLLFGQSAKGFVGWSPAWTALNKRINEARRARGIEPMAAFVVHDIRRTVATKMADPLNIEPHHIDAALNHWSGVGRSGVSGTYIRAKYAPAIRTAYARWDDHLRTLIEGAERTVLAFPAAS